MSVTSKTIELINNIFPIDDREIVVSFLNSECGINLPGCDMYSPEQLERICFAVIKFADGSTEQLKSAINIAKTDWRDLLMYVGFAENVNAHNIWADTALSMSRQE